MNFCSGCGGKLKQAIPPMDNRLRYICSHCELVHYENPKVIVGSLPVWQDKVLLCRRAIEPRLGYWTLPAGFLENNETMLQGAIRETEEEAGATFNNSTLYRIFDIPVISQIYVFYLAQLDSPDYAKGIESLEVDFFEEKHIPWAELAFPVMRHALQDYFSDRTRGEFPVWYGETDNSLLIVDNL